MRKSASFRGHVAAPTYPETPLREAARFVATIARGFRDERNTAENLDEACIAWLKGRHYDVTERAS